MRELDDREKAILRRIQSGTGRNLYSLIGEWTQGVGFWVTRSKGDLKIRFHINDPANAALDIRVADIQSLVLQCVMLVKQLEERYVIHTMQSVHSPEDEFPVGEWPQDVPFAERIFPDPRVSELFCRYAGVEIIPTLELKKFIEADFRSPEAVRADRQFQLATDAFALSRSAFKVSRNAFILAVAVAVLNIIALIWNISHTASRPNSPTSINASSTSCHGNH